jgi:hypothetical protein
MYKARVLHTLKAFLNEKIAMSVNKPGVPNTDVEVRDINGKAQMAEATSPART